MRPENWRGARSSPGSRREANVRKSIWLGRRSVFDDELANIPLRYHFINCLESFFWGGEARIGARVPADRMWRHGADIVTRRPTKGAVSNGFRLSREIAMSIEPRNPFSPSTHHILDFILYYLYLSVHRVLFLLVAFNSHFSFRVWQCGRVSLSSPCFREREIPECNIYTVERSRIPADKRSSSFSHFPHLK